MRCRLLGLSFAVTLLCSCSTLQETSAGSPVELPDATPFDSNPISRMAYLDAYRDGYRAAERNGPTSTDFIRGPHRFAKELGWRAGASAAQADLDEQTNSQR